MQLWMSPKMSHLGKELSAEHERDFISDFMKSPSMSRTSTCEEPGKFGSDLDVVLQVVYEYQWVS